MKKFLALIILVTFTIVGTCSTATANEASCKPTEKSHYVLIHGTFQGSWVWYKVQKMLEDRGHDVTALNMPGHGISTRPIKNIKMSDYVKKVVRFIKSLDDDENVILVGHGTGGGIISLVAEKMPEKIEKLVYLSAFLVPDGLTMEGIHWYDNKKSLVDYDIKERTDNVILLNKNIQEVFYNTSPANTEYLANHLLRRHQPVMPFFKEIEVSAERFGSIPRYYISTLKDNVITPKCQQYMYEETPCEKVFKLNCDHSSMFSKPKKLTDILIRIGQ